MREILFRGKRVDNGEWIEGDLRHWRNGTVGIHSDALERTLPVLPATVGQYTGLKDRNGQRIFEGDIVQVHYVNKYVDRYGSKYQVNMDNERRGWWPFACGDGCGCCEEDTVPPCDCEVIGNIHDNPEMMEGER